ncbi:MAG: hypothetical protein HY298_11110 [Verrucomicrobia bacterium]|nr:hypothetical protein [Verrucomicrobiota bacterium]
MNTTKKHSLVKRVASNEKAFQHSLAIGLALATLWTGSLPAQVTLDPA